LGSYAIRAANCFSALSSFSRGFHRAIALGSNGQPFWTPRAITDLALWRSFFVLSLHDPSILSLPWSSVGLLQYRASDGFPPERLTNRALRQRRAASFLVYSDACTTLNGLGFYLPLHCWGSAFLPALTSYSREDGSFVPVDINLLEFAGCVWAAIMATEIFLANPCPIRHIHILTDNMSCVSWVLRHRATHPLHLFFLYVLSFLQIRYRLVITIGHVAGVDNIYADAASRNFDCPDGARLLHELSPLPKRSLPPGFERSIAFLSSKASLPTSLILQEAVTASVCGPSSDSAPPISWNMTSPVSVVMNMPFTLPVHFDSDLSALEL